MLELFLATRPPWPTSKNMKIHRFLQYATRVRNSRRKEQKKKNKTKTDSKKDPETLEKTAPARDQTSTTNHRKKASKIVQTTSPNGLFFELSARPFPQAPRRRQKTPPGGPKDAPRGPKGGPRVPQGPPGPPPGRPKIAQNATAPFGGKPLGPPGRPKRRPKGLRKPFWGDFSPPGPRFWSFVQLKTRRTQTKTRNQRKRSGTQRRAGGVLPTWFPN